MKSAATTFRTLLYLGAVLAAAAVVSSCADPARETTASQLDRGVGDEPESLDPHRTRTTQAHTVQRDLFEGLVTYSAAGELVGGVAERWTLSDDGRVYTFTLRDDARWSNGDPVTADDFVYSFRRLVDPETAAFYAEMLVAVENATGIVAGELPPESLGVSAPEKNRFEIRLAYPVPYFLSQLALPPAFPVHAGNIAEHGETFARAGKLVSNGAYQLHRWDLGSFIELHRNPHYWNNDHTAIDRVRHHVIVEASTELYRYRAGELQLTQTVPSEAYAQLAAERPDELKVAPFLGTYFYGFNMTRDKFASSPSLRQALSMAIDRDVLTEKVTARGERPAYSWVPPGVMNYEPPQFAYASMERAERHATAQRLYAEAGYGPGNEPVIEIRYNTAETHERIALAIQAMWRDVLGFEARLVNEELRVLIANIREMEITDVFRLSWNGDFNDAYAFLSIFESDNPSNLTGYTNTRYDSLLDNAARQTDPQRRRLYLEEAERLLLDDHPVIPLYYHVSKHLVSPAVTGWQDNVLDFHYSQHLSLREPVDTE